MEKVCHSFCTNRGPHTHPPILQQEQQQQQQPPRLVFRRSSSSSSVSSSNNNNSSTKSNHHPHHNHCYYHQHPEEIEEEEAFDPPPELVTTLPTARRQLLQDTSSTALSIFLGSYSASLFQQRLQPQHQRAYADENEDTKDHQSRQDDDDNDDNSRNEGLTGVSSRKNDPNPTAEKTGLSGIDPIHNGGIVTVQIASKKEAELGVELYETELRGIRILAIRRIVTPNNRNRSLREGMILLVPRSEDEVKKNTGRLEFASAVAWQDITRNLQLGPYPLALQFYNLAAGGDAISDLGSSIVTPKEALTLAQQLDEPPRRQQHLPQQQQTTRSATEFKIITTSPKQAASSCAIQSRRNDVLEIDYVAAYVDSTGTRKVVYDASSFRSTTTGYRMVLGSGDMLTGVDLGLYDMCPGDERTLIIPPQLGHGKRSLPVYRIPPDYQQLEWTIKLISIDETIRGETNTISREDRESRFAYD